MGLLIDTGVLIAVERDQRSWHEAYQEIGNEQVAISAITVSELLHGVHRANTAARRAKRSEFVEGLLEFLPVLDFDLAVARVHASIWAEVMASGRNDTHHFRPLAAEGVTIDAHDLMIAATALHHDLSVLTTNVSHFGVVGDLGVVAFPSSED